MTVNDVIKLLDAGYTKEDIVKLEENVKTPNEGGNEQEKDEAGLDPDSGGEHNEDLKALNEQVKGLTETVKALQQEAAKNAESPKPEKVTADSIIKSFFGDGKGA